MVEAARCQLMEYKQLVMQLQAQIKRTKAKGGANSAAVAALSGIPSSPTSAALGSSLGLNASVASVQPRQMQSFIHSPNNIGSIGARSPEGIGS